MKRSIVLILAFALALSLPVKGEEPPEPLRIAFIDSGISTKHIDPAHVEKGINLVFPDADTQDRIGHGTATAGMVLGSPEQGVTGTCPEAVAVPYVVLDTYPSGVVENGGWEALCKAIYAAVDDGCRIINISLSTTEDTQELRDAVACAEERGVVVVSAVGNSGEEGSTCYPAAYETVIAVGTADGNTVASFSQTGADLVVDGLQLTAATRRNRMQAEAVSGTSYSCALLTGLCGRLLELYPGLAPAELRSKLYSMAADILEPGFDSLSGWGVVSPGLFPFRDVPPDSWSYPGIRYVHEAGWMNGVGNGYFAPEAPLNRAMLVTILWRMENMPEAEKSSAFTDVPEAAWYHPAICWAASVGIVEGYGNGLFGPKEEITREQLAVILYRYASGLGRDTEYGGRELTGYADAESVSTWAYDALCWAVHTGLMNGSGANRLAPGDPADRGQTAAVLLRFSGTQSD